MVSMRNSLPLGLVLLLLTACAGRQTVPEAPPPAQTPVLELPPAPREGSEAHKGPSPSAWLVRQAHAEMAAGSLVKATVTLERAIRLDPQAPMPWLLLASIRLQQGKASEARQLHAKAANLLGRGENSVDARRLYNDLSARLAP